MTFCQNPTGVKIIFASVNFFIFIYMIGSIIGAGVSLFSNIFGGAKASAAAKKAEQELRAQRQANEDWYRRRYNEDYTQTAEAQRLMTQAREMAKDQLQSAIGRQAVMGGTQEVDAARKSGADLVSDTLSDLAVIGSQRKDAIESQYRQRDAQLSEQYRQMYNQQAANMTSAANSGMEAGMGFLKSSLGSQMGTGKGLFASLFNKKKEA